MRRRLPVAQLVLSALAVATVPGSSWPAVDRAGRVGRCSFAVVVGDGLRCDEEAPRRIADVCGGDHRSAETAIAPGDRVDPWALCVLGDPAGHGRMNVVDLAALAQPTDPNRASIEELEGLPGVGPALAKRIVEGRPHASVDALAEVRGIGPRTLDRMRARLVVTNGSR